MKRKKFVKILMGNGFDRNSANAIAKSIIGDRRMNYVGICGYIDQMYETANALDNFIKAWRVID